MGPSTLRLGVMRRSPLAGGFLSGKCRKEDTSGSGRLSGPNPFGNSKFTEQNLVILEVLRAVAAELDRPMAEVALGRSTIADRWPRT